MSARLHKLLQLLWRVPSIVTRLMSARWRAGYERAERTHPEPSPPKDIVGISGWPPNIRVGEGLWFAKAAARFAARSTSASAIPGMYMVNPSP